MPVGGAEAGSQSSSYKQLAVAAECLFRYAAAAWLYAVASGLGAGSGHHPVLRPARLARF